MCQILRPEEETKELAQPRGDSTPRNNYYVRQSDSIGVQERIRSSMSNRDPAELLQPDRNFRRANESSSDRLWHHENNMPLYEQRDQSRSELRMSQSRERYF